MLPISSELTISEERNSSPVRGRTRGPRSRARRSARQTSSDEVEVVLDEQHAVTSADRGEHLAQPLALDLGEARGGLVEQQQ